MNKLILILSCLLLAIPCQAKIIFVDADANGLNDGSSWANAYNYLRDALTAASSGDEIRVAQGIYRPDEDIFYPYGTGDRIATFQLINGITLKGGYAGISQPDPDARDIEAYKTILSGDLLGNDANDVSNLLNELTRLENSYHVITGSETDANTVLNGFTITAGNANYPDRWENKSFGAGMLNYGANLEISNCIFSRNSAMSFGGAIFNSSGSPILNNCTFTGNQGGDGGAICNWGCSLTANNCVFSGNHTSRGGGMYNSGRDQTITLINCIFSRNSADWEGGGGMYNDAGNTMLINCLFSGNSASSEGGGILNDYFSCSTIINCTFIANSAEVGGAVFNFQWSNTILTNCILWGNTALSGPQIAARENFAYPPPPPSSLTVASSCVQGGAAGVYARPYNLLNWGSGNISTDPLFIDADGADNKFGTSDDNPRLLPNSPCIDTGDNSSIPQEVFTDLDGDLRIANDIVDIGAYEGPDQGFLFGAESITVPEKGIAAFTVALAMKPSQTIEATIVRHSGDQDITVLSGATLTFDSSNYFQPQTVTLAAAEDKDHFTGKALIWISASGFITGGLVATEEENEPYPDALLVDSHAPGVRNGTNWKDAFTDLQEALSAVRETLDINQIWVAQGVYRPTGPSGNREATFQLIDGITIKGGYAGFGQPDPNVRNIEKYETILSGDLNGNDEILNDPCDLLIHPSRAENSYHVVTATDCEPNAVLDGFTITGGNANFYRYPVYHNSGGGLYGLYYGAPTVDHCKIIANSAHYSGGVCIDGSIRNSIINGNAAYNFGAGGCSELVNCIIHGNVATTGPAGAMGAAVSIDTVFSNNTAKGAGGVTTFSNSSPLFIRCSFIDNSAGKNGGVIFSDNCWSCPHAYPEFHYCKFIGNRAEGNGGALYVTGNALITFTGCIIAGNTAEGSYGGAFYQQYELYPGFGSSMVNCILTGNRALGEYPDDDDLDFYSNSQSFYTGRYMTNCIVQDHLAYPENSSQDAQVRLNDDNDDGEPLINYCCIKGCTGHLGGVGNINANPCFVRPGYWDPNGTPEEPHDDFWVDGDYHLKSEGWRWDTSRKVWTWDEVTSRCIDAGNPGSSLGDEPLTIPVDPNNQWGHNLRIDMGAYGGTSEASMPPHNWALLADLTNNGIVDLVDLMYWAENWLITDSDWPGDLDRNGVVDLADLALFADDWLKETTWHR